MSASTQKLFAIKRLVSYDSLPTACEDVICNISTSLQGVGLRWANHLTKATKPPLEHYDSLPEPALNEWPGVLSHRSDGKLSETDNWAFWCFISPFIRFYHYRLFEYTVLFLNSFFAPSAHMGHHSLHLVAGYVNYEEQLSSKFTPQAFQKKSAVIFSKVNIISYKHIYCIFWLYRSVTVSVIHWDHFAPFTQCVYQLCTNPGFSFHGILWVAKNQTSSSFMDNTIETDHLRIPGKSQAQLLVNASPDFSLTWFLSSFLKLLMLLDCLSGLSPSYCIRELVTSWHTIIMYLWLRSFTISQTVLK